jgi:tryptophan 2,3-dioxygenase
MTDTRAEESTHWDMAPADSYGGYLRLDEMLTLQSPRSDEHDEMLFVIIHQASELWMKLCLHELRQVLDSLQRDDLTLASKSLARIARIQRQMIQSWDVLSTLTPAEYNRFRDALAISSGFQSYQYRQLEFMLGNKDARLMEVHRHTPRHIAILDSALRAPSLYDEVLALLSRRGFAVPDTALARDWSKAYIPDPKIEQIWLDIYRAPEAHWDLYEMAEKLVDLEDQFQQWRFRHLKTVERVIGMKTGTGGSSGAPYRARALSLQFFPELWSLRTKL